VLRDLATYRILVFGSLLVAMVILRPKGLLPAPTPELQDRARDLVREDEVEEAA
jgi:ABC-type branched-subunit amino acid transport system permease subunit